MGLINSIDSIEKTIREEQQEIKRYRHQKQLQQIKDQNKKEDLSRYKEDMRAYIEAEMLDFLIDAGHAASYIFYNIEKKDQILNDFFNTIKEYKGNFEIIPYKRDLETYYKVQYYKTLKECENQIKLNDKYKIIALGNEETARIIKEQERVKRTWYGKALLFIAKKP